MIRTLKVLEKRSIFLYEEGKVFQCLLNGFMIVMAQQTNKLKIFGATCKYV